MQPFLARGFYIAAKLQRSQQVPKNQGHPGTIQNVGRLTGIEIEDHGIGGLGGTDSGQRHMEFKRGQILYPHQRREIVDQADGHLLFMLQADLRGFHPGGTMHRTALLEKEILIHSFGIAL